jgi:endonuclease-3
MKRADDVPKRAKRVLSRLKKAYPNARLELDFSSPFELLVSLILAAQCTDERVNEVTGKLLFRKYREPAEYARARPQVLEADIRPTGFYRNKAKALRGCSQALLDRFGGRVPQTLEELTSLPGVGRKTANILLGNAFGVPAIGVDTHVMRLSQRLGFSAQRDPDKIEKDLTAVVARRDWVRCCHLLQAHGRRVCVARKPRCYECVVRDLCPHEPKTEAPPARRPRPGFGFKNGPGSE